MTNPDASNPLRERSGCVIGIALGLLILGSVIAWIALPKTEARDGAQLLATWFEGKSAPIPYAIEDARKLMGGEEVVKLVDATAAPERELVVPGPEASSEREVRMQWDRVEVGAGDTLPRWLLFVRYPQERGDGNIRRLFDASLTPGRVQDVGKEGGRMLLELGTLHWGKLDPAYVLEREFERGGTFRDIVRVNLSSPNSPLLLHASWSRSMPFSKARLEAVLAPLARE